MNKGGVMKLTKNPLSRLCRAMRFGNMRLVFPFLLEDLMKKLGFLSSFLVTIVSVFSNAEANNAADFESYPAQRIERFQKLYEPFLGMGNDLVSKIIDNKGNGYENLYGLRNFRVVLHGVLYRGGANNAFHRDHPRNNMNPLPEDGLQNLCRESFGEAIYLYDTNYVPKTVNCTSRTGTANSLNYTQFSVLSVPINPNPNQLANDERDVVPHAQQLRDALARVYKCAIELGSCPIYIHCWNGWHASGLLAAVALRQFCGFTGEQAVNYWVDATDSLSNSNYPKVKQAIQDFIPIPELSVTQSIQAKICPSNPYK